MIGGDRWNEIIRTSIERCFGFLRNFKILGSVWTFENCGCKGNLQEEIVRKMNKRIFVCVHIILIACIWFSGHKSRVMPKKLGILGLQNSGFTGSA